MACGKLMASHSKNNSDNNSCQKLLYKWFAICQAVAVVACFRNHDVCGVIHTYWARAAACNHRCSGPSTGYSKPPLNRAPIYSRYQFIFTTDCASA